MNKAKLTSLCHKVSKETGLTFNQVMIYYFLEKILEKLAKGKHSEKIVFKGGFVLSNVIGLNTRSTVDIDFLIRNTEMSKENILKILQDSLESVDDDITYEIKSIRKIKEEDKYGGFTISVLCRIENIRQMIPLDIATGDVITPYPIDYNYKSAFNDENIMIKAYPIETMVAEKIETIFSRGILNSRSKDYYDLYILFKLKKNELDKKTLREAISRTFNYRGTELNYEAIIELIGELKEDLKFIKQWDMYKKKNKYVEVGFADVILVIIDLIKFIEC